jgi:hypothetical protein
MDVKGKITWRHFLPAAFLLATSLVRAQTLIVTQVADGGPATGSWQTTIPVTNTSGSPATFSVTLFQETGAGGGATAPWDLQFVGVSSLQNISLKGGETMLLQSPGTNSTLVVGFAEIQGSGPIQAYGIFTQRIPGRTNQQGTAEGQPAATRVLVPYNNTNGQVTTMAIANPTDASESIAVGLLPSGGTATQPANITLAANGHASFAFTTQFPSTDNGSGVAEFYISSGAISVLALNFNGGAFSTSPVYAELGPPFIASGGSTGALNFNVLTMEASTSTSSPPGVLLPELGIAEIGVAKTNGTYRGIIVGLFYDATGLPNGGYVATWSTVTVSGDTLTFTGLQSSDSYMQSSASNIAPITTGTLTVTLAPGTTSSGTYTGTLDLVSTLQTVGGTGASGAFTGTYTIGQ